MPRYTFGGTIRDLTAFPSGAITGTLTLAVDTVLTFYRSPTATVAETDFVLDPNGDEVFDTAASSIRTRADGYIPSFQGPNDITTLYFDPDPTDTEVRRVLVIARDANTGGAPDSSTTAKGLVRIATNAEIDDTATTPSVFVVPNLAGVRRAIATHASLTTGAHPTYDAAIEEIQAALAGKVDKDANGDVSLDSLPAATGATKDTLAQRGTDATLTAADAVVDTNLATLKQVKSEAAKAATAGGDVRALSYNPTTAATSSSATAFTKIPDIVVADAESKQKWRCDYELTCRGTTTAGIQVRHAVSAAGVSNKLANPSFETDTSNWGNSTSGITTISRGTTGGGYDGTAYMVLTSTGTGNLMAVSEWVPIGSATVVSQGIYVKPGVGTIRSARVDTQWATDAAGTGLTTDLGSGTAFPLTAGTWTRVMKGETTGTAPPAGATHARFRFVYTGVVAGDSVFVDAAQLELTAPLPAYGATGGSGTSSFGSTGHWFGLATGATATTAPTGHGASSNGYTKVVAVRTTSGTNMTGGFGALGTTTDSIVTGSFDVAIGGEGLTKQRIELEFAQGVQDTTTGNATTVVAARATFALIS